MDTKTCSMRIVEKHINKFYKKFQNAETVAVQDD